MFPACVETCGAARGHYGSGVVLLYDERPLLRGDGQPAPSDDRRGDEPVICAEVCAAVLAPRPGRAGATGAGRRYLPRPAHGREPQVHDFDGLFAGPVAVGALVLVVEGLGQRA